MLKTIKTVGFAGLVAACASMASATVVGPPMMQTIDFDDVPNNGLSSYTTADGEFTFNPTNLQSSSLCADSSTGGNGSCLIEAQGQGAGTADDAVTTLTRNETNNPTMNPNQDDTFNLVSFYFLLTGNVTGGPNVSPGQYLLVNGSDGSTQQFDLGSTYGNVTNYSDGLAAGALVKNKGYIASFSTNFLNVTSVDWFGSQGGNIRLDCVKVSYQHAPGGPNGSNCGIGTTVVPLPAGLPLVLTGMAGFALLRRRKKA